MAKFTKKIVSTCLAALMAASVFTVASAAAAAQQQVRLQQATAQT